MATSVIAIDRTARSTAIESNGLSYDYLLVVGPGRSGSTFLHDILDSHRQFQAPSIKEGYYYRRPADVVHLCDRLGIESTMLLDVANLAYIDSMLIPGLAALHKHGVRTLLVILYRDHRDRAVSMMAYRKSRGEFSAWFGRKNLEMAVVRDSLKPDVMTSIYGVDADVLTIAFPTLVKNTSLVLRIIADLCGIEAFREFPRRHLNEALQARSIVLSAGGKLAALAMRRMKLYRTLQRLKLSPWVNAVFFKPKSAAEKYHLSAESESLLADWTHACRDAIEHSSERIEQGVWLKRTTASS